LIVFWLQTVQAVSRVGLDLAPKEAREPPPGPLLGRGLLEDCRNVCPTRSWRRFEPSVVDPEQSDGLPSSKSLPRAGWL